jgi:hypothetical protein
LPFRRKRGQVRKAEERGSKGGAHQSRWMNGSTTDGGLAYEYQGHWVDLPDHRNKFARPWTPLFS